MSRAVDETGYVQPTRTDLIAMRGVSSVGYHTNPITGWLIRPGWQRHLSTRSRGHERVTLLRARGDLRPRRHRAGRRSRIGAARRAAGEAACAGEARRRKNRRRFGIGRPATPVGDRRVGHRHRARWRGAPARTRHAGRRRADLRGALRRMPRQNGEGRAERRPGRPPAGRRVSHSRATRGRPRRLAATGRMRRPCSTTFAARCRPTRPAR